MKIICLAVCHPVSCIHASIHMSTFTHSHLLSTYGHTSIHATKPPFTHSHSFINILYSRIHTSIHISTSLFNHELHAFHVLKHINTYSYLHVFISPFTHLHRSIQAFTRPFTHSHLHLNINHTIQAFTFIHPQPHLHINPYSCFKAGHATIFKLHDNDSTTKRQRNRASGTRKNSKKENS